MSQHLEKLIQTVPAVVYQFSVTPDGRWSFPYLSEGVRELYECSAEAVRATPYLMSDCIIEEDRERHRLSVLLAMEEFAPWELEFRIRTPSGAIKWVRGQAHPDHQNDGSVLWNGIFADISKHKAIETRLLRIQKLYTALIESNRLISSIQDSPTLFKGICKIAVELGGMKMAWIGVPNAVGQYLKVVARFGEGSGILDEPDFFARLDIAEERGQAALSFSENRTILNQDFLRGFNTARWHDFGKDYGFGSSASFPILKDDQPIAVLTVYRTDIDGFDDESVTLIERLASDVSQAVTALAGIAERKRLEEALRFRQFGIDHADEEIFWIDRDGRIFEANQTACHVLGYTHSELLNLTVFDIDPNFTVEEWTVQWQALKQKKNLRFESNQISRDGLICPTEVVANYFEYQGVEYNCALVRNITEQKIMVAALAESQQQFSLFMDTLPAAAFIKEENGTILYANRYMLDIFGTQNCLGRSSRNLYPPELKEKMAEDDQTALDTGHLVTEEKIPLPNSLIQTYQMHRFRIPRQGQRPLLGGIALDITERKQMEETILNLGYFDALTNLPNRRMLLDRLAQALVRAARHRNSLALMFMDLDHFKIINDSLGHDIGDELLKEVAIRLKSCVRTGDTVSRHGGDEFIILLPEISHPKDAALVANKIIRAINAPVQISDNVLKISTSIGIAVFPIDGSDDVNELLKKADVAMYAAKDEGRNRYRFFA